MGLFSFLKKAGSSLFKDKEAEARKAAAAEAKELEMDTYRGNLLESIVNGSGIAVENFSVEYNDDTAVLYGQANSLEDKEKVILIVGNVEGVATVDDRISVVAPPQSRFYEVKPGDSLSKISQEMYGDPMKYNGIFEANKPMLSHPDKIYPGQMLRIPNL